MFSQPTFLTGDLRFFFCLPFLGQHNDARMNVALAMTAACHGATVANHCEVINLTKDEEGKVNGAKMRDNLTGEEWTVKAKVCLIIKDDKAQTMTNCVTLGCYQCYRSFY